MSGLEAKGQQPTPLYTKFEPPREFEVTLKFHTAFQISNQMPIFLKSLHSKYFTIAANQTTQNQK